MNPKINVTINISFDEFFDQNKMWMNNNTRMRMIDFNSHYLIT